MSKISCRDVWIILAGYLAAIHVGKLSAVIPVLQQDLNLRYRLGSQSGFEIIRPINNLFDRQSDVLKRHNTDV